MFFGGMGGAGSESKNKIIKGFFNMGNMGGRGNSSFKINLGNMGGHEHGGNRQNSKNIITIGGFDFFFKK